MTWRISTLLVIAVLVGCSLAMPRRGGPPGRGPGGRGPGGRRPMVGPGGDEKHRFRRRHHNPLLMMACSIVNTTSGESIKERECPDGITCSLGPLSFELCDGTPVQTTYCAAAPDSNRRRPTLVKLACSLQSADGSIDRSKPCPHNATCSAGPLTLSVNGTDAEAMFCQRENTEHECEEKGEDERPHRRPFGGRDSSEEEDEDSELEAEGFLGEDSSSEEEERDFGDRRRQFGGRRAGRQKRRAGGSRRHRNPLMGLACLVVDEEGDAKETRHQCSQDIGCNVGPLELSTRHGELSAFYCKEDAVQTEGDGLGLVDLACQLAFDDGTVESETCPRDAECSLGSLDVVVDGQNAEASFCHRVARVEEEGAAEEESEGSSSHSGRGGQGGRGRRPGGDRGDRPQRPDSSEEEMTTQAAPRLPIDP